MGRGARITASVKNTSAREGDEVTQFYVNGGGAADDPIRQLRGFERVHLKAAEARDVQFVIREEIPGNKVRISVGGGQPIGQVPHIDGTL